MQWVTKDQSCTAPACVNTSATTCSCVGTAMLDSTTPLEAGDNWAHMAGEISVSAVNNAGAATLLHSPLKLHEPPITLGCCPQDLRDKNQVRVPC